MNLPASFKKKEGTAYRLSDPASYLLRTRNDAVAVRNNYMSAGYDAFIEPWQGERSKGWIVYVAVIKQYYTGSTPQIIQTIKQRGRNKYYTKAIKKEAKPEKNMRTQAWFDALPGKIQKEYNKRKFAILPH